MLEGLGPTVAESAIVYETSDLKKLAEPRKAAADARSVETINFADKFARVHLARLCSAVSECSMRHCIVSYHETCCCAKNLGAGVDLACARY